MAKKAVQKEQAATPQVCEFCGWGRPYHRVDCPKVAGRYCPACEARHPRHYGHCPLDQLGIGRWWVGREGQKVLEELYMIEREAALAQGVQLSAVVDIEPRWYVGADQPIRPAESRKLIERVMAMMKCPSIKEKDAMRQAIHDEIELLAGREG